MKTMATVVVLLIAQLSQVSPFEGDWRTDIPSDLNRWNIIAVPSGITFAVTANRVRITDHSLGPDGRSQAFENVLQTDGKPHASTVGSGWTVVATWSNPDVLDLMYTGRGVRVLTIHVTYSLSSDRKTLTRRGDYWYNGYTDERTFYR